MNVFSRMILRATLGYTLLTKTANFRVSSLTSSRQSRNYNQRNNYGNDRDKVTHRKHYNKSYDKNFRGVGHNGNRFHKNNNERGGHKFRGNYWIGRDERENLTYEVEQRVTKMQKDRGFSQRHTDDFQQMNKKEDMLKKVGSWDSERKIDKYQMSRDTKYGYEGMEDYTKLIDLETEIMATHMGDEDVAKAKHIQESIRKKQKGFYRVMKKYYEGTATDPDLLTWDAKQQIKHLHKMDPEEWTHERLAESFPASRNQIRNLLKMKPRIMEVKDLVEHDERIRKNWKNLSDASKGKGPLRFRYEELVAKGKLKQLAYAVGNTVLPMPKFDFPDHRVVPSHDGPFSKMIQTYVDMQKREQIEKHQLSQQQEKDMYELSKKMSLNAIKSLLTSIPESERSSTSQLPSTNQTLLQDGLNASPAWKDASQPIKYKKDFRVRDKDVMTKEESKLDSLSVDAFAPLSMFDALGEEHESMEPEADFEDWMKNKDKNLQAQLEGRDIADSHRIGRVASGGLHGEGRDDMAGANVGQYIGQMNRRGAMKNRTGSSPLSSSWQLDDSGMAGTRKAGSGESEYDAMLKEMGEMPKYQKDYDKVDSWGGRFMSDDDYGRSQKFAPRTYGQDKDKRVRIEQGEDYYDDEDGEFLFRVPTQKS